MTSGHEQTPAPPGVTTGATSSPGTRDDVWAAVAQLTAELRRCAAAAIDRALAGAPDAAATLVGRTGDEMRAALSSLEATTRRSAWALEASPSNPGAQDNDANRRSLERGIDLRMIVDESAVKGAITGTAKVLERIRVSSVQCQMILIDEERAVLTGPRLVAGSGPSGWDIREESTVAAARNLWHETQRWSTPLPSTTIVLTDRQREIAVRLLDGMTDAAIARALGVSVRTVAGEVRTLVDAVGARSRFQAASRLFGQ
jgi:DNA-binding CsgD family transcriptional regulator